MLTADFDYQLPRECIAQTPIEPRDSSRLMVLDRSSGNTHHRHFFDIEEYLRSGDVLVLNDSRVVPARLAGRKVDGGAAVSLLLLNRVAPGVWETLARPSRRLAPGTSVEFTSAERGSHDPHLSAEVLSKTDEGTTLVRFSNEEVLEELGEVPLPPYIHTPLLDAERYQTVYARTKGSVAAPTAGLHFTRGLMERLEARGVQFVFVALHVGLGSFRPVKVDDPTKHVLHSEYCEVGQEEAQIINLARSGGMRIVCVGTTALRAIEFAAGAGGEVQAFRGWNDLYILPGYHFRIADALITNFHLPRSTLLMLVAAFAGRERILQAYRDAIGLGYRFFSFGDSMLII